MPRGEALQLRKDVVYAALLSRVAFHRAGIASSWAPTLSGPLLAITEPESRGSAGFLYYRPAAHRIHIAEPLSQFQEQWRERQRYPTPLSGRNVDIHRLCPRRVIRTLDCYLPIRAWLPSSSL